MSQSLPLGTPVDLRIGDRPVHLGTLLCAGYKQEPVYYVVAPGRKQIGVIPQSVIEKAVAA